jgi:protoporphyrinogen/coproporphyrinogen III oxidase
VSPRVLVVGGGITGLAAAYDLARSGVPTTLVERRPRWGGKVQTEVVEGFVVEAGPDSFVSYRPAAEQLAAEVGLGDQIVRTLDPRLVTLRRHGRMVAFPEHMGIVLPTRLGPFVTTPLFSWPQKVRAGLDLVLPRQLDDHDVAVGEFLRTRLGAALVTQLADPLFGGIYGTSVDELSLDAVLPQLRVAEQQHRSLLLASLAQGRTARAAAATPGASPFRSLRWGMGSLVDAVVAHLERDGVDMRPGTGVTGLERAGGRTQVRLCDGTASTVDAVVLAVPGPQAVGLLQTDAPAAAGLVAAVRHASTAVVSLGFSEAAFPRPPVGHGFLEAGPDKAVFSGCTFTSQKWPGRAPAGTVLLRAFLPNRSAGVLASSDGDVLDRVESEIATVLGTTRAPIMRRLDRWSQSMPVYTVGHVERMDRLDAAMRDRPGWVLAGATYRGVGVPDCIASGRAAASRVLTLLSGSDGAG